MQRPPGDFGAEPPRPPPAAPAGADLEFPEEWGSFELPSPEGAAVPDAPPLGAVADRLAREFSRELSEPPCPPPAACGPSWPSAHDASGLGAHGGAGAVRVRGEGHLGLAEPSAPG